LAAAKQQIGIMEIKVEKGAILSQLLRDSETKETNEW
jgi:hypothetical protein